MKIRPDVIAAMEDYILASLKKPTSPGSKVELVPELVRVLNEINCPRRQCQPDDLSSSG